MEEPPDDAGGPDNDAANYLGLAAAILLVVIAVWVLIAFKHSSATMDCLAAHHRDC